MTLTKLINDFNYFRAINWQFLVLDEAQAIKNSSSARWQALLALNTRNRLLLTGTPIQNSMQYVPRPFCSGTLLMSV